MGVSSITFTYMELPPSYEEAIQQPVEPFDNSSVGNFYRQVSQRTPVSVRNLVRQASSRIHLLREEEATDEDIGKWICYSLIFLFLFFVLPIAIIFVYNS